MDLPLQLSIEQQFELRVLSEQAQDLTAEQSREMLLELIKQMMIKDNIVKHLLKNNLGDPPTR